MIYLDSDCKDNTEYWNRGAMEWVGSAHFSFFFVCVFICVIYTVLSSMYELSIPAYYTE